MNRKRKKTLPWLVLSVFLPLTLFLILEKNAPETRIEKVFARESLHDAKPPEIWRLEVPKTWKRIDPQELSTDTRLPNLSFEIQGEKAPILITLHNFPAEQLQERVPISMQITRWKRQLTNLDEVSLREVPFTQSGYRGLLLTAKGEKEGKSHAFIAVALQMDNELFEALRVESAERQTQFMNRQRRSDFTLKAQGDPEDLVLHEEDILNSFESFELIAGITPLD